MIWALTPELSSVNKEWAHTVGTGSYLDSLEFGETLGIISLATSNTFIISLATSSRTES